MDDIKLKDLATCLVRQSRTSLNTVREQEKGYSRINKEVHKNERWARHMKEIVPKKASRVN